MAKQSFSVGQVLTAAQVNALQTNDFNQTVSTKTISYVLVAEDKGTRIVMNSTSATTITVNTGLFDTGDTLYIHNTNSGLSTITAGTATVSTSGSLVLAQNQGGLLYFTSASASIFFQFATPASGDIEGVTAGTGISGGGTSGTVTVTNSMATAIDAKGDLIVGTGADTFSRLAAGTNTYILTADSAEATGLKWAAPAAGASFVGASVTKDGTAQSLSNATYTAIVYQTEDYDTDTFHSTSSNTSRFTIPAGKSGKYLFTVVVNFATDNAGDRRLAIYKNGSAVLYAVGITSTNNSDTRIGTSVVYNLVATDYIEIFAFQNSGTSINLRGGAIENQFTITYLGA
jgi:hypothetical protein